MTLNCEGRAGYSNLNLITARHSCQNDSEFKLSLIKGIGFVCSSKSIIEQFKSMNKILGNQTSNKDVLILNPEDMLRLGEF